MTEFDDVWEMINSIELPAPEPTWVVTADPPATATVKNKRLYTIEVPREKEIDAATGHIVWNGSTKLFKHFVTVGDLEAYILSLEPELRQYHERIYACNKQKLRLDVDDKDCKLTMEDIIEIRSAIFSAFVYCFGECIDYKQILVCDSSGADKQSMHFIIDGYYVSGNTAARKFAETVAMYVGKRIASTIDLGIYKTATGLRLAYNYSRSSGRVKRIPVGCTFRQTVITHIDGCSELKLNMQLMNTIDKENNTRGGGNGNKDNTNNVTDETLQSVLDIIPAEILDGLKFRDRVGNFINFTRERESVCPLSNNESHGKDNTLYAIVTKTRVHIRCRHCSKNNNTISIVRPVVKNVDNNTGNDNNKGNTGKPTPPTVEELCAKDADVPVFVYQGRTIIIEGMMCDYDINETTIIVRAPPGVGKSQSLKRYNHDMNARGKYVNKTCIVITSRIVLTGETIALLNEDAPADQKFVSYLENKDTERPINPTTHPRVVVQCESLHRVTGDYDCVIIDETESAVQQLFASTQHMPREVMEVFLRLLETSNRAVFIDANMSQHVIDIITKLRGPGTFYYSKADHNPDIKHYVSALPESYSAVIGVLNRKLVDGAVPIIASNSIKFCERLAEILAKDYPDKKIACYTSKNQLIITEGKSVNDIWSAFDIVIYSPTVTAGISFTRRHFTHFFGFWTHKSADYNACIQMLRRSRIIISGEYYHAVKQGYNADKKDANVASEYVRHHRTLNNLADELGIEEPKARVFIYDAAFELYLWVVAMRRQSEANFLALFINGLKLLGHVTLPMVTVAVSADTTKRLRRVGMEIDAKNAVEIAAARELTDDEYETARRQSNRPRDLQCAIELAYLRRFYNFGGKLDATAIAKLSEVKFRLQYLRRKRYEGFGDEVREDVVNSCARAMFVDIADGVSLEVAKKLFSMQRERYALALLGVFGLRLGSTEVLTRAKVVECIKQNHMYLMANCKNICDSFGADDTKIPDTIDDKNISQFLSFINGKLSGHYGISVVNLDTHRKNYGIKDGFYKELNAMISAKV